MRTTPILRRTFHLAAVAAGVAFAFVPVAASAQQPIPGVVVETTAKRDLSRAEVLETQAAFEERTPKGWRDAASLYRRAAELRGNSPEAAVAHQRAAWLYSAIGNHGKGRQELERSARIALDRGDVVKAANTLYDAALMAATGRDVRATDQTLQRLEVLLDAPLMPDDVRTTIKQRLTEPARLARR